MKVHFDDLFTLLDNQLVAKVEVTSSDVLFRQGETVPNVTTLFGVALVLLKSHDFEVTGSPGNGCEIKACYVR
ncbi:hypothetical protein GCM10023091_36510 [Ravibacter arvi]|uniref:Uncharacterized protein n=1 Tax=Ravibacter arvi TaxID=2051041 RepID=A0ABP8M8B6_9BACT